MVYALVVRNWMSKCSRPKLCTPICAKDPNGNSDQRVRPR